MASFVTEVANIIVTFPIILFTIQFVPVWFKSWGISSTVIVFTLAISFGLDASVDPLLCYYANKLVEHKKLQTLFTMYAVSTVLYAILIFLLLSGQFTFGTAVVDISQELADYAFGGCYILLIVVHSVTFVSKQGLNILLSTSEAQEINNRDTVSFGEQEQLVTSVTTLLSRNKYVNLTVLFRIISVMLFIGVGSVAGSFNNYNSAGEALCDNSQCVSHDGSADIPVGYGRSCSEDTLFDETTTLLKIYDEAYWNTNYGVGSNSSGFDFNGQTYFSPAELYTPANCNALNVTNSGADGMSSDRYKINTYCNCVQQCQLTCVHSSMSSGYAGIGLMYVALIGSMLAITSHRYMSNKESHFSAAQAHARRGSVSSDGGSVGGDSVSDAEQSSLPHPHGTHRHNLIRGNSFARKQRTKKLDKLMHPRFEFHSFGATMSSMLDNRVLGASMLCWVIDVIIPLLYLSQTLNIVNIILLTPVEVGRSADTAINTGFDSDTAVNSKVYTKIYALGGDLSCLSVDTNSNEDIEHQYGAANSIQSTYSELWYCQTDALAGTMMLYYVSALAVGVLGYSVWHHVFCKPSYTGESPALKAAIERKKALQKHADVKIRPHSTSIPLRSEPLVVGIVVSSLMAISQLIFSIYVKMTQPTSNLESNTDVLSRATVFIVISMICGVLSGAKIYLHFEHFYSDVLTYDVFVQHLNMFVHPESINHGPSHVNEKKYRYGHSHHLVHREILYSIVILWMPKIVVLLTYFILSIALFNISPGCGTTFAGDGNENENEVSTMDQKASTNCTSDTYSAELIYYLSSVVFLSSCILAAFSALWQYLKYPIRFNHQVNECCVILPVYTCWYKVIPLCSVPPPRSGDQCGPPLLYSL